LFRGETIIRRNVPDPKIVLKIHEIPGNVARENVTRGNEIRGNEIRRNIARANEIRGNAIRGKVTRGKRFSEV
jgi:hypothetical protein